MLKALFLVLGFIVSKYAFCVFVSTNVQTSNNNTGVFLSNQGNKCSVTALNNGNQVFYVTSAHCIGSCSLDGQFNIHAGLSATVHFPNGYAASIQSVSISNGNICEMTAIRTENDYAFLTLNNLNAFNQPNGYNAQPGVCAAPVRLKGVPGSLWNTFLLNGLFPVFRVQQKHSSDFESQRVNFNLIYHNNIPANATTLRVNELSSEGGQSGGALVDNNNNLCGILSSRVGDYSTYYVAKTRLINHINNLNNPGLTLNINVIPVPFIAYMVMFG